MLRQLLAVLAVLLAREVLGQLGEVGAEQGQQRAEALGVATVRGRRHQDEVLTVLAGERLDKLVPLLPARRAPAWLGEVGAGVGLIDDDQLRTPRQEILRGANLP